MSVIKKITAIMLALIILSFSSITTLAANRKSSLSDYAGKGSLKMKETLLSGFNSIADIYETSVPNISFDTNDKKEGAASLACNIPSSGSFTVFNINNFGNVDMTPSESRRVTLKMWINISDMSKVKADHEDLYSHDYSNSATIFFRAYSNMASSDHHAINQTIWGSGWQEVEFDLGHNNGVSESFDISNVTGAYLTVFTSGAVTIKVDNLRVCTYTSKGYTADTSDIIDGARIISTCDYDALDGSMVNEWFDADYSENIKHSGSSSVHGFSDASDDQRMYFSDNDIPLDYENDYLCFWMYIDNIANLTGLFIEANEIQDTHEYELTNAVSKLALFSNTTLENNKWVMMQIPLKAMAKHYGDSMGESVTLKVFRICPSAKPGTEVNVYIDSIFVADKNSVLKYNSQNQTENEDETVSTSLSSKTENDDTETENNNSNIGVTVLYVAIIGVAVLLVVILLIVALIIRKKQSNTADMTKK